MDHIKFDKNKIAFLEKIQLKKSSKNYIAEILKNSFKKKKKKTEKKLMNVIFIESAKNLIFIEMHRNIEKKILLSILNVSQFISEEMKIFRKFLKIFHIFTSIPVIKYGNLVQIVKGKNKNSIGKVNNLCNDFSFVFLQFYKKFSIKNMALDSKRKGEILSKKKPLLENMGEKIRNDNLIQFNPYKKCKNEKAFFSVSEHANQNSNVLTPKVKNLFFQFSNFKIGAIFWSKNEKLFKILTEKKNKELKLLAFDNSAKIYSFADFCENFIEIKKPTCKGFDCFGNIIFCNEEVIVISRKLKNFRGIVKFIKKNRAFIYCPAISRNGGIIVLSCNEIMACIKKTRKQLGSVSSPTKMKIKKGLLKGYENKVINQTSEKAEIEISTIGKSVNLSKKTLV